MRVAYYCILTCKITRKIGWDCCEGRTKIMERYRNTNSPDATSQCPELISCHILINYVSTIGIFEVMSSAVMIFGRGVGLSCCRIRVHAC